MWQQLIYKILQSRIYFHSQFDISSIFHLIILYYKLSIFQFHLKNESILKIKILNVWWSGKSVEKTQNLLAHPRYCNRSQIFEKNWGIKALYCERTTHHRARISIGSFFRSVPRESSKKSTRTDDWSIK